MTEQLNDLAFRKGISVIICCYNSAARLPATLKWLAGQELTSGFEWEVIIVDNNSSDDTATVARKEWEQYELSIPFKVVEESKPGLSFARRRGVAAACYELLLFCDDDNWLARDYLSRAFQLMEEHPFAGVSGGQSTAVFESDPPAWFAHFQNAYALGKQMPSSGLANRRRYLAGAGMVVRKCIFDVLDRLGFQNILPDRKGDGLSSGGDSELCLVILFLGYDLLYDEGLQFIHFIPSGRLKWPYCVKMISEAHGVPQIYFSFYKMLYLQIIAGGEPDFGSAYKTTYLNILKYGWRMFNSAGNAGGSLRVLFNKKPGSMREIQLQAFYKNIIFITGRKNPLRTAFAHMKELVQRIVIENKRIHGAHRESFAVQGNPTETIL